MVYQADTIRDQLFGAWSLLDPVAKLGDQTLGFEPVIHLAHPQVVGSERTKTVEVRKLTPLENIIRHPRFEEASDTFEITVRYDLPGVGGQLWDSAESAIEDMEEEVLRIMNQIHNPFDGSGGFFRVIQNWRYADDLDTETPSLKRILLFTITKIRSDEPQVFEGFGGVLTFSSSLTTNADSPPGADYIYTEAHRVRIREGHEVIEHLTKETANGARVPKLASGPYRGFFNADIFAKKDDIGATAEKLNQIFLLQANDEHIDVVFLHANTNTEATTATLTQTSFVKIVEMQKVSEDEQLLGFNVSGRLIKPSTYAVS